jgi:hypothetical protein
MPRYVKARDAGDVDVSAVIVGEAVDLIRRDEGGAAIVQRIVSEAEVHLRHAPQMLG